MSDASHIGGRTAYQERFFEQDWHAGNIRRIKKKKKLSPSVRKLLRSFGMRILQDNNARAALICLECLILGCGPVLAEPAE